MLALRVSYIQRMVVIRRIGSERERVKGNGGTQGLAGDRCGEQRERNVANRVGRARTVLGRGIRGGGW
jgi:hypothetical protein